MSLPTPDPDYLPLSAIFWTLYPRSTPDTMSAFRESHSTAKDIGCALCKDTVFAWHADCQQFLCETHWGFTCKSGHTEKAVPVPTKDSTESNGSLPTLEDAIMPLEEEITRLKKAKNDTYELIDFDPDMLLALDAQLHAAETKLRELQSLSIPQVQDKPADKVKFIEKRGRGKRGPGKPKEPMQECRSPRDHKWSWAMRSQKGTLFEYEQCAKCKAKKRAKYTVVCTDPNKPKELTRILIKGEGTDDGDDLAYEEEEDEEEEEQK